MSAAILQGVPGTTLDTDIWVEVPERQTMRLINLSLRLGATMVRQTVVALSDGSLVNFCYRLHGTASFRTEYGRASGALTCRAMRASLRVWSLEPKSWATAAVPLTRRPATVARSR